MRPVMAAAAASGSRLSVTGSMSAKTGLARSKTIALAEATNENGLVTTSSPSSTPTARSARCRPAVPEETALAWRAPTLAANAVSNVGEPRSERELPGAQHLDDRLLLRFAEDRARASGIAARLAGTRAKGSTPGAARVRTHAGLERVDQRVPAGLDHVLVDADRAPRVGAVGGVEQHARGGAGRLPLVEDADLVVDELDVAQVRVALADRGAQRAVERVHRAVALGDADVALPVDPDLDRRLGLDAAVLALLRDHAPGLKPEQRLVVAALAPDQQVERAVGGLELEAAVLELLHALDHP